MVTLQVDLARLKSDYPGFYDFFKDTLDRSNSKFKTYKEDKYKCFYYVGFYLKPSQKTEEYYDKLYSMKFDERLVEERGKLRVTITIVAGQFAISDQTNDLADTFNDVITYIVSRKMYFEQLKLNNKDVIDSIPNYDEIESKIHEEQEMLNEFFETMGMKVKSLENKNNLTPAQRLKQLIDEEKYEEADEFLSEHPELKKRNKK